MLPAEKSLQQVVYSPIKIVSPKTHTVKFKMACGDVECSNSDPTIQIKYSILNYSGLAIRIFFVATKLL
jgi:hypothetical protein